MVLLVPEVDYNQAFIYGNFVAAAYQAGPLGSSRSIRLPLGYELLTPIYAREIDQELTKQSARGVLFGFIARLPGTREYVVAIRGTSRPWEWAESIKLSLGPPPIAGLPGKTEVGFSKLYRSLRIGPSQSSPSVYAFLKAHVSSIDHVAMAGHSLGGALVELLAIDLASHTLVRPDVYTYGCPNVGTKAFAEFFNGHVPACHRFIMNGDVVPRVPVNDKRLGLDYFAVGQTVVLQGGSSVSGDFLSRHALTNYMYALNRLCDPSVVSTELRLAWTRPVSYAQVADKLGQRAIDKIRQFGDWVGRQKLPFELPKGWFGGKH